MSIGRVVSHFAYPFGRRDDFDDRSVDAVRSAAFDTACTTIPGTARFSTDPYRLPRRLVMDWGRLRFEFSCNDGDLGERVAEPPDGIGGYLRVHRGPLVAAQRSVASVETQTSPPIEIIVCIDHNEELLRKSEEYFRNARPAGAMPLIVLANKYDGRLGSARNTAAEFASGEVLAFLDDDAAAAADWPERLIAPYDDERVGAVGGAPLPVFEVNRPRWFPHEFDWVFGCAYRGLPLTRAPLAHLIGANMSARHSALREVGGFHSDDHDDMDMCHRIAYAQHRVLYEPLAIVHHFVPASRTTWHYFWRRCYLVNQGKVEAFANMQEASSLGAELSFVTRTLTMGVPAEIRT